MLAEGLIPCQVTTRKKAAEAAPNAWWKLGRASTDTTSPQVSAAIDVNPKGSMVEENVLHAHSLTKQARRPRGPVPRQQLCSDWRSEEERRKDLLAPIAILWLVQHTLAWLVQHNLMSQVRVAC